MILDTTCTHCLCKWQYLPNGGKLMLCGLHKNASVSLKLMIKRELIYKLQKEVGINLNYFPRHINNKND